MRIARASALTDPGRRRLQNEDAFVCDPPLFAIADGMGGAQAGELASRLAAAALEERAAGIGGEAAVRGLVETANDRVFRRSLSDPGASGMGTTVTVALVEESEGRLVIGHVGDSRAYRIRDDVIDQLTEDHSLVAELVRSGRLTQEEADQHPHRSVITRVVGTEEAVEVDTLTVPMEPGDVFLLCSDGLPTMVGDEHILAVVRGAEGDLDRAADELVRAANAGGGEDNVTVVLVAIAEGEPAPRAETPPGPPDAGVAEAADGAHSRPSRTWGAGPGGRLPALLLVLVLLAVAALLLFWGMTR
jgi:protein phosphatase